MMCKVLWTSLDGRQFHSVREFDDNHLRNMIPYLTKVIAVQSMHSLFRIGSDIRMCEESELDYIEDMSSVQALIDDDCRTKSLKKLRTRLERECKRRKLQWNTTQTHS